MIFAHKLKTLRLDNHLTQEELSKELGLAKSTIGMYEQGNRLPKYEILEAIADYFNVNMSTLIEDKPLYGNTVKIPVFSRIKADTAIEDAEELVAYEEMALPAAKSNDFFGLKIHGDSMGPRFIDGDVVIVKKQSDVEDGSIAAITIKKNDAAIKRVKKTSGGILLMSSNPAYEAMFFDSNDVADLPVKIIGRVVELRAKF